MSGEGVPSADRALILHITDPFWASDWFLIASLIFILYVGGRLVRRRMIFLREQGKRETAQAVLANEMKMARSIQMGMLPNKTPEIRGFDVAARSSPAIEVGGDFYDFTDAGGGKVGICLGDVSGHGLTGAMIVGLARTSLRFAGSARKHPAQVIAMANGRIHADIRRNLFVAVFYALLDPARRLLTYTCAGQTTPVLIRNGKARFLPYSPGDRLPLGIVPGARYGQEKVQMRKGDALILYTDGIVELRNTRGEDLGFDRFIGMCEKAGRGTAEQLVESLFADMRAFAGTGEQQDDITIIALKVHHG